MPHCVKYMQQGGIQQKVSTVHIIDLGQIFLPESPGQKPVRLSPYHARASSYAVPNALGLLVGVTALFANPYALSPVPH
jgi:hypothetical protein